MQSPDPRSSRYATQHPHTSSSTITRTILNETTNPLDSAVSLSSALGPPPPTHFRSSKSSAIKHFCLPLPHLHSDTYSQSSARVPAELRKKDRHSSTRLSTSTTASMKPQRQSWLWRKNVESAQQYQHQEHDKEDAQTLAEARNSTAEQNLRTPRQRPRQRSINADDTEVQSGALVWRAYPEPLEVYEYDVEGEDVLWEEDLSGDRGEGDCIVRFEADTDHPENRQYRTEQRKEPKFELVVNSARIQGANIAFLNDLLRAGRRTALPVAETSDEPTGQRYPNGLEPNTGAAEEGGVIYRPFPRADNLTVPHRELKRHSLFQLPLLRQYSPLKFPQFEVKSRPGSWNPGSGSTENRVVGAADTRDNHFATTRNQGDGQKDLVRPIADRIRFEVVLAAPAQSDPQSTRAYRLAVRNLFAVLERQPVVGRELVPSLVDVQDLVDAFDMIRVQGSPHKHRSAMVAVQPNSRLVTEYVRSMRLDDVRYDLEQAVAMLAWAEMPAVRWAEGYKELFVHVVGMLSADQRDSEAQAPVVVGFGFTPGVDQLSEVTRTNILAACNALKLILQEAEEKLTDFSYSEMWPRREAEILGEGISSPQHWKSHKQIAAAHRAAEEFRLFVFTYYKKSFGSWPPMPDSQKDHWIDRGIVDSLQADFAMLYEYLVDKDISWERMHASHCREYEMVSKRDVDFQPDMYVPITDILVTYGHDNDLQHIPHPFPLLPVDEQPVKRRSIFGSLSRSKSIPSSVRMDMFAQASNTDLDREGSNFLTAFKQHEANFSAPGVTHQEARLGRWIQLYGILQTLSHLSVDVPGLRYMDDVDYFLCFGINGIPPWSNSSVGRSAVVMPAQERSYCYKAAGSWKTARAVPAESPMRRPAVEMSLVPPPLQLRPSGSGDSGIATPSDVVVEPNHFVMPDGSRVPVPESYLRPSPVHATFVRSNSQSSISALPQIPEKSEKRRKSMSLTLSSTSNGNARPSIDRRQAHSESRTRMSITPSLQSEASNSKKRDTILSMEGTEWADTEFSGDGVEGSEAMAVDLKRGGRGRFVAVEGRASRSTVAEE